MSADGPPGREVAVGVVVPAYNAADWLGEALESVSSQTVAAVDIVVVDDGSTDATAAVAAGFGPPVRCVSQPNAGIGAARNRGIEAVGGDAVLMLDADDLMTPSSLAARAAVLAARPDIELVFGWERRFERVLDGAPVAIGPLLPSHLPGSMLVRRAALDRVGPFPASVRVAEGLDWLLRAREQRVGEVTIEEQVLWRRVHEANNSVRHRAQMGEFAHALKASLDRRRAARPRSGEGV